MFNLNSKILEDIVCDFLDFYFGVNDLFYLNQWGFKKVVFIELLFLYLIEIWKKVIDDGYKVGVFFVDFKKVFDIVDYIIFKFKLLVLRVFGVFYEWIVSYFYERL